MMANDDRTWKRGDSIALLFLFLAVFALFFPALTGSLPIFHDDMAMAEFPWHYFVARHLQQGIIPLWEPDTWCGAIPFYARYYADTYYFPLWPFLLSADLNNLAQTFWMFSLVPLFLHYWLAVAGMYVFSRRSLRLHSFPAFLSSWVYLFSPIFAYKYVAFPIVVVQAWLPWALILVVSMDRRSHLMKVIGLGVIFALMFFAAQPPHVGYSFLLIGVISISLALRRFFSEKGRRALRGPLQIMAAMALSIFLAAVYILPVLDGMEHTEQHLPFTYESMTGADGSMPPVYLATLFIPNLFGTVSGYNNRNWVDAVTHGVRFWDANMSGGLLLTFLALAGLLLLIRRRDGAGLRFWAILGAALWVFSILCMLGRHTPFYYLFYKIVPVLSDFPFPIRYSMIQALATAWLGGLGLECLIYRETSSHYPRPRLIWGYLSLAFLAAVLALFGLAGLRQLPAGKFMVPGLNEIINRGNLEWFITRPVLYFFGAGFSLVLAWRVLRGRRRAKTVAGLVMLETAIFAFAAVYFCIFRFHIPQPQQVRSSGPDLHPMIRRVLGPLTDLRDDPELRWATDQPFHDNFSRLDLSGSFSFMGYDMKPLERRFKKAFEATYKQSVDWPLYWNFPHPETGDFLSNMSVGYLMDSKPGNIFPGGRTVKLETNPDFYLHYNPYSLPRVFTMDQVVECSEDEALAELVNGDLRKAVFVEDDDRLSASDNLSALRGARSPLTPYRALLTDHRSQITDYKSFAGDFVSQDPASRNPHPASIKHFNQLQSANPITGMDFTNPNRVEVDITVTKPVMLILTEVWYPGWKAIVDGGSADLYRVNYLQRGVWLNEGKHRVEIVFLPDSWRRGMIISTASWGILILVLLVWGIRKRIRHYHPTSGSMGEII